MKFVLFVEKVLKPRELENYIVQKKSFNMGVVLGNVAQYAILNQ